jgi:hypothetical protein
MVRFSALFAGVAGMAVALAPAASADEDSYLDALIEAGVLEYGGDYCNMIDGICNGQFQTAQEALSTGRWVCDQIAGGKPKAMIIDWLSQGEGLMPSSYNGRVITNAAIDNLC